MIDDDMENPDYYKPCPRTGCGGYLTVSHNKMFLYECTECDYKEPLYKKEIKATLKKEITIRIEESLYDKFLCLCKLVHEDEDTAIENAIYSYADKMLNSVKLEKDGGHNVGKVIKKIPKWANCPWQNNHRVIKAYFEAERIQGEGKVTKKKMKELCNNKNTKLYVSAFDATYASLKTTNPHANGKVFEDNGVYVWIWNNVKDELMKYKNNFLREEQKTVPTDKPKVILHKKGIHEKDK